MRPKHHRFVDELFLNRMNASRAYVAAGYSPNGADVNAARLMARPEIQEEFQQRQQEHSTETRMTFQRALEMLTHLTETTPDGRVMITATMMLSKLLGWDKTPLEKPQDSISLDDLRRLPLEQRVELITRYGGNAMLHIDEMSSRPYS